MPTVKWAICMAGLQSTVNTELSGFLGFCVCDKWFRKCMLNCVGITFSWAPRGRWSICSPMEYLYLRTRSRCQQNERWLMSKELCRGISHEELCPMGYNLKQISPPWKPAPVTDASHFTENTTCLQKQEFQLKGGTCSWAVLTDVSAMLVAGVETGAHTYFEMAQVFLYTVQTFFGTAVSARGVSSHPPCPAHRANPSCHTTTVHVFLSQSTSQIPPTNPASTSEKQAPVLPQNYWLGSQGRELEAWIFKGNRRHEVNSQVPAPRHPWPRGLLEGSQAARAGRRHLG